MVNRMLQRTRTSKYAAMSTSAPDDASTAPASYRMLCHLSTFTYCVLAIDDTRYQVLFLGEIEEIVEIIQEVLI